MLTKEQNAIVNAEFDDILVVEAYAGCGKTSTLIEFCKKRANDKILYLAYNSSMAAEAKAKFKKLSNVEVMTMHSLAYRFVGINYKERLGNLKPNYLLHFSTIKNLDDRVKNLVASNGLKLYRKFCNSDSQNFESFIDNYNDSNDDIFVDKDVYHFSLELEQAIKEDNELIYEHDFYLKEYQLSKPQLDYDYILVDEAQDINECVTDIVLQQNAKKVFIGDTYQSIYVFRGANNSLQKLSKIKNTKTLHLTNSFRCSPNISQLANKYLKLAGAKNDFIGLNESYIETEQKTIITRTNGKIFEIATHEDNKNKKLFFVGGLKSYNFQDLIDILNLMSSKFEYIKPTSFYSRFKDFDSLREYAEDTEDIEVKSKLNIVYANIDKEPGIYELINRLKRQEVKTEKQADLILTTAHKSKGLEWNNVELANDFIDIKAYIEDGKHYEIEEVNLMYVAITRAKQDLSLAKKYII